MKKLLTILLFFMLLMGFVGCTTTSATTSFSNPDADFCELKPTSGTYLCSTQWTSYFDTKISLSLYYTEADQYVPGEIFEEVETLLEKYHNLFDKYHEYPDLENVFTINQHSSTPDSVDAGFYGTTQISQDLMDALKMVLENENQIMVGTDLLFNIALSPVLNFWHNSRESETCSLSPNLASDVCLPPTEIALSASFNTDPTDIELNETNSTIRFKKPGMGLDLGGFGKGYASEIITDRLDSLGLIYLLNSGNSNIKAGGENPNRDTGDFIIALTEPSFTLSPYASFFSYLQLPAGLSIVTSGSYQNYFLGENDNRLYHHIIDPRTKHPGGDLITITFDNEDNPIITPNNALMAVSILYEDGGYGDIFSTSMFLLSLSEGQAYVESHPGIEAIWYQNDGTITLSAGLTMSTIEVAEGVFKPLILVND